MTASRILARESGVAPESNPPVPESGIIRGSRRRPRYRFPTRNLVVEAGTHRSGRALSQAPSANDTFSTESLSSGASKVKEAAPATVRVCAGARDGLQDPLGLLLTEVGRQDDVGHLGEAILEAVELSLDDPLLQEPEQPAEDGDLERLGSSPATG